MKINKILPIATTLLLTACGGGSSTTDNSSVNPTPVPPPTPQPEKHTFSVKISEVNKCGITTPTKRAQLIIHNDDFTTKTIVQADANGVLKYESENETENISLMYQIYDSSESFAQINTYEDYPMSTREDIQVDLENNTEGCECINNDYFRVSSPEDVGLISIYGQGYSGNGSTRGGSLIEQSYSCHPPNTPWPQLLAFTQSFGGAYLGYINNPPQRDNYIDQPGTLKSISITNNFEHSDYLYAHLSSYFNNDMIIQPFSEELTDTTPQIINKSFYTFELPDITPVNSLLLEAAFQIQQPHQNLENAHKEAYLIQYYRDLATLNTNDIITLNRVSEDDWNSFFNDELQWQDKMSFDYIYVGLSQYGKFYWNIYSEKLTHKANYKNVDLSFIEQYEANDASKYLFFDIGINNFLDISNYQEMFSQSASTKKLNRDSQRYYISQEYVTLPSENGKVNYSHLLDYYFNALKQ